ncbi:MAG: hypothetical protein LBC70_09215, partial [Chitinispirillales bacterium]|nr:hypothetical protein [Chitinispirillales bacterium]
TVANPGSACCAEQPNFNGCQASNPCTGLTTAPPGSACCQHNPNFNGCQVSNPCAGLTTAPPGSACCQHTPTFNGCQGGSTGQFCRWDADPNNCWPIDPASADPNTQSAANCMAEHGEVVSDCNAASTVQYCDWGPPAIVAGDTVGGCFAIPGNVNPVTHCTNDHGIIVSACPNYPPPTEGGFCDYGFGNCIGSAQSMCNQYGAFGPSCPNPSGFYCDFGQPTGYGDGGCYFRPSMASISGALNTAGDCDEWADRVSMTACIASNTTNPCISDPVNPGDGGPAGCNPNPRL